MGITSKKRRIAPEQCGDGMPCGLLAEGMVPVSYTHLDVYKRQVHKVESLETCGAEVQKGNPVVERKLQRLFRQRKVTRLIKR